MFAGQYFSQNCNFQNLRKIEIKSEYHSSLEEIWWYSFCNSHSQIQPNTRLSIFFLLRCLGELRKYAIPISILSLSLMRRPVQAGGKSNKQTIIVYSNILLKLPDSDVNYSNSMIMVNSAIIFDLIPQPPTMTHMAFPVPLLLGLVGVQMSRWSWWDHLSQMILLYWISLSCCPPAWVPWGPLLTLMQTAVLPLTSIYCPLPPPSSLLPPSLPPCPSSGLCLPNINWSSDSAVEWGGGGLSWGQSLTVTDCGKCWG